MCGLNWLVLVGFGVFGVMFIVSVGWVVLFRCIVALCWLGLITLVMCIGLCCLVGLVIDVTWLVVCVYDYMILSFGFCC